MKYSTARSRRLPISTVILLALVAVLMLILCVLSIFRFFPKAQAENPAAIPTQPQQEEAAVPTFPVTPDGMPDSILCRENYTVSGSAAADAADRVITTFGTQELTNAVLQIYYLDAIRTYQAAGNETQPDYTTPLELQLCPLEDGALSWQHYFLQQAIANWQTVQILRSAAQEPRPVTEEAFKPNETDDLHGKYVAKDLPVNNFLYQDLPCYTPNKMHQAYLDGLEAQMQDTASTLGYANLDSYAASVFSGLVSTEDLVQSASDYNFGYMYFTESSYDISVSDEDIAAYQKEHASDLPQEGYTVDIRHILLIPEDSTIAKDGVVTAGSAQWETCRQEAEKLHTSWRQSFLTLKYKEGNFARLANENSMDAGSQINGGSYHGIRPGQLIDELDDWCFDPARQAGDTEIIRSPLGYHIMFFCARHDNSAEAVNEALVKERLLEQVEQRRSKTGSKISYNSVALWVDPAASTVSLVDVLYPDIAHERFPEAIVYFQQDYMFSPYGGSYVGRGGCGITTMAMLATYMTDTILTPHMLAQRYPEYHDASGTMGELFRYTPPEMGFFLEKTTGIIDDVIAALKNGQRVISLQHQGRFTQGGHYLLLQQYYEEDDTFQVRDSNIYNYARLEGHKVDKFPRADLLSGSSTAYIMQKKITRIPACARCGGTFEETAPEKLLTEDYLCPKCGAAILRRSTFLELMGA